MSELLNEKQKQDIFNIVGELLEDLTEEDAEKLVNFLVDLESKEV
jgi:hypothetical protein